MPSTGRFETVVELILACIGSDATGRRFLDCYQSFMAGLHWTMESTMEELAANLDAAFAGPFAQFRAQHEYMLEHYLVAYVFSQSVSVRFAVGEPQVSAASVLSTAFHANIN